MTRRHLPSNDSSGQSEKDSQKTEVFAKTKMCKFHVLGMCSKGGSCRFAHGRADLRPLPDLYRTKLCVALQRDGKCDQDDCGYAHSNAELRHTWRQGDAQRQGKRQATPAAQKVGPEASPTKNQWPEGLSSWQFDVPEFAQQCSALPVTALRAATSPQAKSMSTPIHQEITQGNIFGQIAGAMLDAHWPKGLKSDQSFSSWPTTDLHRSFSEMELASSLSSEDTSNYGANENSAGPPPPDFSVKPKCMVDDVEFGNPRSFLDGVLSYSPAYISPHRSPYGSLCVTGTTQQTMMPSKVWDGSHPNSSTEFPFSENMSNSSTGLPLHWVSLSL